MSAWGRSLLALGLTLFALPGWAQLEPAPDLSLLGGDPQRGRLVYAPCRTCHYTAPEMGHGNGPNLYRIFGKVAGKQPGFEHYSPTLQAAQFVWTPQLLYAWLENPIGIMPDTTMMSAGVADPRDRADLIAYLQQLTVQANAAWLFPQNDRAAVAE